MVENLKDRVEEEVGHMKKAWVLRYPLSAMQILRSDWAKAQAVLSLRFAYTLFVYYVLVTCSLFMECKLIGLR